jgi:hypothetical protein
MSQVPSNQGKLISFGVMAFFALVVLLTLSGSIFRTIQPGDWILKMSKVKVFL